MALTPVLAVALAAAAAAQVGLRPDAPASYFAAMPVQGDAARVRRLLDEMHERCTEADAPCEPGAALLELLFRGAYRDQLPDFIVDLYRDPETGGLKTRQPQLIFDRKTTPYLHSAEHLNVLVFSPVEVPMQARLTTIRAGGVNPLSGIFSLFGVSPDMERREPQTADAGAAVEWRRLSDDGGYFGLARVPVESEVVARLTLLPETAAEAMAAGEGETEAGTAAAATPQATPEDLDFHVITGHISNSRGSRAGFGAALGSTFGIEETRLAERGGDPSFNAYVLAKFYLPSRWPRLQVSPSARSLYRSSVSVVLGTNVSNDAFEELVIGLSWGHLVGKSGLLVAGNWIEGLDDGGRELRLLVGIDYSF